MVNYFRLPFLFLAILGLLLGLWTGLYRIGWVLALPAVAPHHGAIMIGGFLGTLISLEKIIPMKKKYLYAVPVTSAAATICFLLDLHHAGFAALVLASTGLSAVFLSYAIRVKNNIYLLMLGGSICWLTGNILLATRTSYPLSFPWWLAFALCIITAERLELMKFLPVSERTKRWPLVFLALYVAGVLMSFHGPGQKISGMALIAIALWLMRFDVTAISLRKRGLARFVGTALLSGYVALLFTGIFLVALTDQAMAYDAVVHTFFLGFVFSMIFAHGPIILPGVLGISTKPYHKLLYAWLILLHLSWVTRVAGDILLQFEVRRLSAAVSVSAILCYFVTIATLTVISQRRHAKVL